MSNDNKNIIITHPLYEDLKVSIGRFFKAYIKTMNRVNTLKGDTNYRKNTPNPNTKSKANKTFLKKIGVK